VSHNTPTASAVAADSSVTDNVSAVGFPRVPAVVVVFAVAGVPAADVLAAVNVPGAPDVFPTCFQRSWPLLLLASLQLLAYLLLLPPSCCFLPAVVGFPAVDGFPDFAVVPAVACDPVVLLLL
jgi:hypothetical protein